MAVFGMDTKPTSMAWSPTHCRDQLPPVRAVAGTPLFQLAMVVIILCAESLSWKMDL